MKKRIALLGSTGSIGTQTLEVVRQHPEYFSVEVLTAHANYNLLIRQALEFRPNAVVIGNDEYYAEVMEALDLHGIKVYAGKDSLWQIVSMETIDMVLVALVGFSGLKPTLAALEAGKPVALANKEVLVVAGEMVTTLAREKGVSINPVDSEHSAVFQCLAGERQNPVEKIYLTASGGPFLGRDRAFLSAVSHQQALQHPNWSMGKKITIDSASLMNKGLEVIEAKWLFGLEPGQIDVIIHPQSVVHSIVQFRDGSMKAQMGLPDMKLPILYALSYPLRLNTSFPRFSFLDYPKLTFEPPVTDNFRNLALAYEALREGGNMPCILNAANEIVVTAFLNDKIGFLEMPDVIEKCMQQISYIKNPGFQDYLDTDLAAREFARSLIKPD